MCTDTTINMITLKNPLHLFRIDGRTLKLPMLTATWLPRGPGVTKDLNEAVAARHLVLNSISKRTPSQVVALNFYKPHFFDFRLEDELLPDIRCKTIFSENRSLLAVTRTESSKRFRSLLDKLLPQAVVPGTDLLFALNAGGYFASYEEMAREVLTALHHFKCLKSAGDFHYPKGRVSPPCYSDSAWSSFRRLTDLENLSYLLAASVKDSAQLVDQIQLVQRSLKEKGSDLAVL